MNRWKQACCAETGVLLIVLTLLLLRLGVNELGSADEATHAQVAREMARDGHWLYPTCRGEPYFEKPPLKFWLTALTFLVAGESEFTARLGSALFGLGAVWGVMRLGSLLFNRGVGLAAGLVLVTTWEFLFNHCARTGEMDSALLFFSALSVVALWKARVERNPRNLYAAALWLALGFLTKGHLALLPLLWLPLVWWVKPRFEVIPTGGGQEGERQESWHPEPPSPHLPPPTSSCFSPRHLALACAIFLGISAPWFLLQLLHYGGRFWDYMFRHNLAGYAMGTVERADISARYCLELVLWLDYPWPPMILLGGLMFFCRKLTTEFARIHVARLWLLAWFGVTTLVFALSKTKLPWYHLPILIPASVMAGFALERWWTVGERRDPRYATRRRDEALWRSRIGFGEARSFRGWNWLWLVLHVGLLFLLTGFADCLFKALKAWQQNDVLTFANYGYYFFKDPNQRSVWVALAVLPVGLLGWLGARDKSFVVLQRLRVLLFSGTAVVFAALGIFAPRESEMARETVEQVLATQRPGDGTLAVHLFDAYHEQAPHYLVSPALYYYLAASPKIQIHQHPPDPDHWRRFLKTPHPTCAEVIPAAWMADPDTRDENAVPLRKIRNAQLICVPARNGDDSTVHPSSRLR